DVDHLLDLTEALRGDLADFYGDQAAERGLGDAQFFAQKADQLAALGRRHEAPFKESLVGGVDCLGGTFGTVFGKLADLLAGDRRADSERAAGVALRLHAEVAEDFLYVG